MTPPNEPIITAEGVRRRYGSGSSTFEAVRGVDLEVRRGELFALLGTNGAGKTSLLEVIEGMATPSDGAVHVFGKDPYRQRREVRPRTGIMLQDAGFPGDIRTGEMLRTWAATLARPRPAGEVLEAVNLAHRADVAVSSLSGGERRRLDLALAVVGNPEVLFLDEPTTGLDPESRRDAWRLVRGLMAGGTTVVLTTHYLEEAEDLADRIAIMHDGVIVREGTAAQIVAGEPATILFSVPDDAAALPALTGRPSVHSRAEGETRYSITTDQLQRDLQILLTWAEQHRLELGGLHARAASLEQAFLRIAQPDKEMAA